MFCTVALTMSEQSSIKLYNTRKNVVNHVLLHSEVNAEEKYNVTSEFVCECCLAAARKLVNNNKLEGIYLNARILF